MLLISPLKSDAKVVYLTDSESDSEIQTMKDMKIEYSLLENLPFRGVLLDPITFKTATGYVVAGNNLEEKGLDALPKEVSQSDNIFNLQDLIEAAVLALLTGYIIGDRSK